MAGFEVVVRPVVFPNIRPAPARSLPPVDDPAKGFAVIKGNGAKSMTTTDSFSMSMSRSRSVETERRVDEARVYQMDDDGTVNRDNFVDIQVANRIKKRGGKGPAVDNGGPGTSTPGMLPHPAMSSYQKQVEYYNRVTAKDNVEIQKTDVIITNPDAGPDE